MKTFLTLAICGIGYLSAAALPAESFWYNPGQVVVKDAEQGTAPRVEFNRHIMREARIGYSAAVRLAGEVAPACDGKVGPFTYQPDNGPIFKKDLVWWVAGNEACRNLPQGTYWVETCWEVATPARAVLPALLKDLFGWLLPPKHVCRNSAPFEIT